MPAPLTKTQPFVGGGAVGEGALGEEERHDRRIAREQAELNVDGGLARAPVGGARDALGQPVELRAAVPGGVQAGTPGTRPEDRPQEVGIV
jgi:hypothetical protein